MTSQTFVIVSEDQRPSFLHSKLGNACIAFESATFDWAGRLSNDYSGGYWEFCRLENGGFFMYPFCDRAFSCAWENGASETLSAEAFGIVACLFALSHISLRWGRTAMGERIGDAYDYILAYARTREDWQQIAAMID